MFKKNSIGEKINEILIKNGENVYCGTSFEDAVKNSSRLFKNIMRNPVKDQKNLIFNPFSGKSEMVEDWIAFIHYELLLLFKSSAKFSDEDVLVIDFIKTALMYEYSEIYFRYFD